jgi:hypothetical protein
MKRDPKPSKPPVRYRVVTDVDGYQQRVKVVMLHGWEGYVVRFTTACSGCVPDEENTCPSRGFGCEECGYTGKRRRREWIPFDAAAWDRHHTVVWQRLERLRAYCAKQRKLREGDVI